MNPTRKTTASVAVGGKKETIDDIEREKVPRLLHLGRKQTWAEDEVCS